MPEFKKQHYLPRVYLRAWARAEDKHVFWHNESQGRWVPYGDQCQKPNFYSKDRAQEAESEMWSYETSWGRFLREVEDVGYAVAPVSNSWLAPSNPLDFCTHLLARNIYFERHGDGDGFDAYRTAYTAYALGFGPGRWAPALEHRESRADGTQHVKQADNFLEVEVPQADVRSVLLTSARPLVTSDNPVIAVGRDNEIHGYALPATPRHLLVVWNPARVVVDLSPLSPRSSEAANLLQWKNCVRSIYADRTCTPPKNRPKLASGSIIHHDHSPSEVYGRTWDVRELGDLLRPVDPHRAEQA